MKAANMPFRRFLYAKNIVKHIKILPIFKSEIDFKFN